jgi:cytochrome c oxidase assembly protein subunit 15
MSHKENEQGPLSGSAERGLRFQTLATLIFTLAVILWGAYVRATGSGAGCGEHWPLCNGVVIPRSPEVATLIEFAHRVSSGLNLILVLFLFVRIFRSFPRGHSLRLWGGLSLAFILSEALIGAGLVLLKLVAHDPSLTRAISLGLHLVNTFLLVGTLGILTVSVFRFGESLSLLQMRGRWRVWAFVSLSGCFLVGITGAIAALGDTLFPEKLSLLNGLQQDLSGASPLLLRLRVLHPFLAVGLAVVLIFGVEGIRSRWGSGRLRLYRAAQGVKVLVFAQVAFGFLNLSLLAPIWSQLVHLFLADTLWLAVVLLCVELSSSGVTQVETSGTAS